jgi:hypothetical protein
LQPHLDKQDRQYRHLLVFDLTSYGSALALINRYADDQSVKVFEVSPCGSAALLLLVAKEIQELQIIQSEAQKLFAPQILKSALISEIHENLLPTYLSQNKNSISEHLAVLEFSNLSDALVCSQQVLQSGAELLDLRVVRTYPINTIVCLTGSGLGELIKKFSSARTTLIENLQPAVKEYF